MHIEIHSKSDCPWCVKAKEWLTSKDHFYSEIIHDKVEERNDFYDKYKLVGSKRTMPQIFIIHENDEIYVGGYNQLETSGL